jgi:hypothetical protein
MSHRKAGVANLSQNLGRAIGPELRVNAVTPDAVDICWQIDWGVEAKRLSAEKAQPARCSAQRASPRSSSSSASVPRW